GQGAIGPRRTGDCTRGPRRRGVVCTSQTKTQKRKTQPRKLSGLGSGDVLLSHDLSSHYHRGCSVSLPCSEWERVVPLRYCHQSPMPDWRFAASRRGKPMPNSGGVIPDQRWGSILLITPHFQKTTVL